MFLFVPFVKLKKLRKECITTLIMKKYYIGLIIIIVLYVCFIIFKFSSWISQQNLYYEM